MVGMRKVHCLPVFGALLVALAPAAGTGGQAPRPAAALAKPQLVIIDTDIGDDIDDAFALALALRSPELHILGIITGFGNTPLRARLADRFLAAVGRAAIPVAVGAQTPETSFTQGAYARGEPLHSHPGAVDFLLREIRAHPGQITLIAIAPLDNEQAAIARDAATFRQLRRVVMMGGSIDRGYNDRKTGAHRPPDPEWNIRCDPAGARALLASGVPIYMMPLDSTQIQLPARDRAWIFSRETPLTRQLHLLYEEWSAATGRRTPVLYDPVAVTYAIRPSLCPVQPMRLRVDAKGYTHPVAGAPNVQVCLHSDESEILRFVAGRIAGAELPGAGAW